MVRVSVSLFLVVIAAAGAIWSISRSDGVFASEGKEFSTSIERALSQSQDSGEALNEMAESSAFQSIFGSSAGGTTLQASAGATSSQGTPTPDGTPEATLTPEQKLDLQAAELQTGAPTQLQIDVRRSRMSGVCGTTWRKRNTNSWCGGSMRLPNMRTVISASRGTVWTR